MKRFLCCGIALLALAASGWGNASPFDIPELCGGLEILEAREVVERAYEADRLTVTSAGIHAE